MANEELKNEVIGNINGWFFWLTFWLSANYVVGVIGVVSGVLAAGALGSVIGDSKSVQEIAGLIAAAASAVLGFLKPEKLYIKYSVPYGMVKAAYAEFLVDSDAGKLAKINTEAIKLVNSSQS